MFSNKFASSFTVFVAVLSILFITPVSVLAQQQGNLEGAVSAVEQAITDGMPQSQRSGQSGPTLQQLGGVQGGSTSSDAVGGAGSEGGGGGGGGGGCFAPETLVLMADGTGKAIGDIKVGDVVFGWDFEAGKLVPCKVAKTYAVERDISYLINGSVRATPEHPFYVGTSGDKEKDTRTVEELTAGTMVMALTRDSDEELRQLKIESLKKMLGNAGFNCASPHPLDH